MIDQFMNIRRIRGVFFLYLANLPFAVALSIFLCLFSPLFYIHYLISLSVFLLAFAPRSKCY